MAYNILILDILALFSGFAAFGNRGLSTLSTYVQYCTCIVHMLKTAVIHLHIVKCTPNFLIHDCKLSLIYKSVVIAMLFILLIVSSIIYDKPHIAGPKSDLSSPISSSLGCVLTNLLDN